MLHFSKGDQKFDMKKYIIFSEVKFNFLRQRHQIFAQLLSDDYSVHFIEGVPSRIPKDIVLRLVGRLFRRKKKHDTLFRVGNITIRKSFLVPSINIIFNLYNIIRVHSILWNASKGDIVHVFSSSPMVLQIAKRKGCIVIFDVIHNWMHFPFHKNVHRRNYTRQLFDADIILCDSQAVISNMCTRLHVDSTKVEYVPPGVEDAWFPVSTERPNINKQNISVIFFGNLRKNSDLELCKEIILLRDTEAQFCGLLDPSLGVTTIAHLQKYYKGNFLLEDLISQVQRADAIMLPYDKSKLSETIFPAKYFECLATGKPIVSNSNMPHLPGWDDVVWTVDDIKCLGWSKLLDVHYRSISDKQVAIARDNSWNKRVEKIIERVNDFV